MSDKAIKPHCWECQSANPGEVLDGICSCLLADQLELDAIREYWRGDLSDSEAFSDRGSRVGWVDGRSR